MAHLSLSLLGPFQVSLNGEPVTTFESTKVRALLAYLAVEADRPHRRDVLAGLLWPEWPDRAALSNLRYALYNLRQVIGDRTAQPPFLLITRNTLQFNTASDHWLDVAAFTDLTGLRDLSGLEKAVALYRGCFLEGFFVSDSPAFEEWALFKRERLARQMSSALHGLAAAHEARGDYEQAQAYARRKLELEPWDEAAHRQVMRLLALGGQRGAALVHYETCRRLLAEELDVEPARATTALDESIRDGTFYDRETKRRRDKVFAVPLSPSLVSPSSFVGRERELASLDGFLDLALAGQGQVVFVTGEAGSGKTVLVREFTRRAMAAHSDLVVAAGRCNAQSGIGDPYLPFREILQMLSGDVEHQRAGGAITGQHARRLWSLLPHAARALVDDGPDLVDRLLPGAALALRAEVFAPGGAAWRTRLEGLVRQRSASLAGGVALHQTDLFEQITRVLQSLARQHPLVLVLDDLQWADAGSVSLLFHLGRRLAGSRILVVGLYRPGDVALGRGGERHPLELVVNEFQRHLGAIQVDLTQAEGRPFVEALLDMEPNRLGAAFRETLYRHTGGHPLFTVELLRGLQGHGDLVQDEAGRWMEGPTLDWERLPARVEAVIAELIGRLPDEWQAMLAVASVEGEEFTAEVVARVQAADEQEIIRQLSGELSKRYHLVSAQSLQRLGKALSLSRYRFRHYLFQRYLYNSLDQVERAHLHEATGNVLEALYTEGAEEIAAIAPHLARHFQEGGIPQKAVAYLLQAGNRAARLSAHEEAIAHFRKGLELLQALPDTPERARQEIALRIYLAAVLINLRGFGHTEVGQAYERAYELCERIGETLRMTTVAHGLFVYYFTRAEYGPALETAERLPNITPKKSRLRRLVSDHDLAFVFLLMGELDKSLKHAQQAIASYSPHLNRLVIREGGLAGVASWSVAGVILQLLGHPDQSRERLHEALAMARDVAHPSTLALALFFSALASQLRRDVQTTQGHTMELVTLSTEYGFQMFLAFGIALQGRIMAMQGQAAEGVAQIRRGLAMSRATGAECFRSYFLSLLAETYKETGQLEEGLAALNDGIAFVERTGERFYEAEIHRLKGELLWIQGEDEAEVEGYYQHAIQVARRQSAKSWELRAAMSLSRLWREQGRVDEARQMLAEIYGRFTEGFDTPDLQEAKALLEELSPD